MAKKTPSNEDAPEAASCETAAEESAKVDAAARAVACAEAELAKARALYDKVRDEAAERIKAARETTVGELIDCTTETVKKYPLAGLTVAALFGLFLGRLFRR